MRKRFAAPMVACLALAVPAGASAHARTTTVALDYRLVLDREAVGGARVEILDGDRSLRITASARPVVVLGDLGEPMLRIGAGGTFASRASATAVAEKLVAPGRGWRRVGARSFAWHDHRLAPPPYAAGRTGPVARFRIPLRVGGRRAAIAGSFVRYRRPVVWPWAVGAAVVLGVALVYGRASSVRGRLTLLAGALAGLAAVSSLASFGVADSPTGRVAWVELGLAVFVALAAAIGLVRLHGEHRVTLAALIGAAAAATTLGSLGIFRHAVVISAVPAAAARLLCAVAFTAGAAAAATGLAPTERRA